MKVTLISHTEDPIGTLCRIWDASKEVEPLDELPDRSGETFSAFGIVPHKQDDLDLFRDIISQQVPCAEHIVFNFIVEDAPISWREQAVRHRVGVRYGDNFGADVVPELDQTSFWSQSMRLLDMSKFAEEERYYMPESIAKSEAAERVYREAMQDIEHAYAWLVELGVPLEDARNVIPLGATSRIAVAINLRTLQHIIGKRSCWILQSSLWGPFIMGAIQELTEKIHPIFRELVYPPCVQNGKYNECVFKHENERRVDGRDKLPVCPLYFSYETDEETRQAYGANARMMNQVYHRCNEYAVLWNQTNLPRDWRWEDR